MTTTISTESIPMVPTLHMYPPLANQGRPQAQTVQANQGQQVLPQNNDANTKDLFISAFQLVFADDLQGNHTMTGLSSSTKSTKMLNRVHKDSVRAFCSLTIKNNVPEMFKILDSNENIMTKQQEVEDKLGKAQWANAMVKFTVQKEFVKEMMQHAFYSELFAKNMMHGFTPFCIQKKSL